MSGLIISFSLSAVAVVALCMWRKARRKERARGLLFGGGEPARLSLSSLRTHFRRLASISGSRRGRAALLVSASAMILLITHNPFLAASSWPAYAAARRLAKSRKSARSLMALEEQTLELIDSLNQSLRSGLSLLQALETSREDVGSEIAAEVTLVVRDVGLGAGLEESLARAAERAPSPSLRLSFTILALLHGKGGDLPRILDRLRGRVQEGLEVKRETRMLTSQSRASGYLVASLPLAFVALQGVLNPRSLRPLLSTPAGNLMAAVAVALNAGAFLIIRKMVNQGV